MAIGAMWSIRHSCGAPHYSFRGATAWRGKLEAGHAGHVARACAASHFAGPLHAGCGIVVVVSCCGIHNIHNIVVALKVGATAFVPVRMWLCPAYRSYWL